MANPWALPERLTLNQASSTQKRLLSAIETQPEGQGVCIDASALHVFDSSALAVLLECRRSAVSRGRDFAVDGLPEALAGLAELYGVGTLLKGPG